MPKISREQSEPDENKFLSELMKNSRENIDTIAKHCGFSRQKAWRMMKQLEASQKIWGYSAIVDSDKQGLQKFMLFFKRLYKPHNPKDAIEIATTHMNPMKKDLGITILSSYRIHGEYDWVIVFTAKDVMQAKKFCDALMERFPDTQTTHLSQILFTVREQCIQNPNVIEMKDFI
jgi:DNA-binding Lrp family transcriptional regulator